MKYLLSFGILAAAVASQAQVMTLSENFDDVNTLSASGWAQQNNSATVGTTTWFQGNSTVFAAQAGAAGSYIGANYNSTTGTNDISTWLITPELQLGGTFTFFTRTTTGSAFPDRLEVRQSSAGSSTNVGTGPTGTGVFTTLLTSINPNLAAGGYPDTWTQFTVQTTGTGTGRVAFRYNVTGGGPNGNNSDYIGIDTVQYTAAVPEPASMAVLGLGALGLIRRRRNKSA